MGWREGVEGGRGRERTHNQHTQRHTPASSPTPRHTTQHTTYNAQQPTNQHASRITTPSHDPAASPDTLPTAAPPLPCQSDVPTSQTHSTRHILSQVFGKPVLVNQSVRFKLAELKTEIELLRALLYRGTAMYVGGGDATLLASMAKLKVGTCCKIHRPSSDHPSDLQCYLDLT